MTSYLFICFRIGTGVGFGPEDPENPDWRRAGAGLGAGGPDS